MAHRGRDSQLLVLTSHADVLIHHSINSYNSPLPLYQLVFQLISHVKLKDIQGLYYDAIFPTVEPIKCE